MLRLELEVTLYACPPSSALHGAHTARPTVETLREHSELENNDKPSSAMQCGANGKGKRAQRSKPKDELLGWDGGSAKTDRSEARGVMGCVTLLRECCGGPRATAAAAAAAAGKQRVRLPDAMADTSMLASGDEGNCEGIKRQINAWHDGATRPLQSRALPR